MKLLCLKQFMRKIYFSIALSSLIACPIFAQNFEPSFTPAQYEQQYQKRIKMDSIDGIYIPKDMDEVYAQLNVKIDAKSKAKFMHTSEDTISKFAVKSLGSWMIHNWGFFEGSRLGEFLRTKGVYHPEDQASFLVISYYRYLNNLPQDEENRIKAFQVKRKAEVTARNLKGTVISEEKIPAKVKK